MKNSRRSFSTRRVGIQAGWLLACAGGLLGAILAMPLPATAAPMTLHQAVRTNDLARVMEILTENPGAVNTVVGNDVTPLHIAAAADFAALAEELLARGADIEACTKSGFMPLHWAASRGAEETARVLLAHGADVNTQTRAGLTPLHWAGAKNSLEMVKLLLRAGANTEILTVDGMTPLHWAVMHQAKETAELLAFKQVSEEMENEPPEPEPDVPSPPEAVEPVAEEPATPTARPRLQVTTDETSGKTLLVDIGFGETLSFVWIKSLWLWVGKTELSNGQFRRFRHSHDSGARENFSLNDNHQPAVQISWNDAKAFADWLNKTYPANLPSGMTARLPTSSEWMGMAACGTRRIYPWGNEWPPRYGNFSDLAARRELAEWTGIRGYDDGFPVTCRVDQSGANEWGILGLGGNVWEWCEDWSYISPTSKIRHGGSWDFDREPTLRIAMQGFDRPEVSTDTIGFRLVLAPRR